MDSADTPTSGVPPVADPVMYREVQGFFTPWLTLAVVAMAAGAWFVVVADWAELTSSSGGGAPLWLNVAVLAFVGVVVPVAFVTLRLVVEVTERGVRARIAPQPQGRFIAWDDMAAYAAVRYRPIREYGGWGWRGTRRRGAYNAKGDRGIYFELRGGATFLIGTQQPEAFEAAVAKASGRAPGRLTTRETT